MFMDEKGVRHKDREEEILKDGLAQLQELFKEHDHIILSARPPAGERASGKNFGKREKRADLP